MPTIRLLILSGTHDDAFPTISEPTHPNIDVLLHCGDLTRIGGLSNYRRAISNILSIPTSLRLVIPGNHDVSLNAKWWAENLIPDEDDPEESKLAQELFSNAECMTLLDEGVYRFTLDSGASFTLYASPYTPAFGG